MTLLSGFALSSWSDQTEEAYAFRKRLECVHERDRRDPTVTCAADEFAFADGARIALQGKAAECVAVARDFEDYLRVSMDVEVSVTVRPGSAARYAVMASLDEKLPARQCRVSVSDGGAGCWFDGAFVPAPAVEVLDTTAAGDTLLAEWCFSGDPKLAVAAGSAACTMPGGEPPAIELVERLSKGT